MKDPEVSMYLNLEKRITFIIKGGGFKGTISPD
jgi:hypothetical protein